MLASHAGMVLQQWHVCLDVWAAALRVVILCAL